MLLNCLYENVSLIFCFLKCCADMSQRPDKIRLGRETSTSSAQKEKQALCPPMIGRGRGGGTRFYRVDVAGGSSSQTDPPQMVDPTQYHKEYQQHYHEEAYQPQYQDEYQPQYQRRGINRSIRRRISLSIRRHICLNISRLSMVWRMSVAPFFGDQGYLISF